jgi:precorrin-6A synthase
VRLFVIGIGAGDPSFVTAQAADALRAVDVFLLLDKGEAKAELAEVRSDVLARWVPGGGYRVVEIADPVRAGDQPYEQAVDAWHDERVGRIERALAEEVGSEESAGLLVWGDPAWFDSTLRLVERLRQRGVVDLDCTVVPGVSSIEVLAARHGIPVNRVGRSVLVTTGRRLRADGLPEGVDDAVVMLDGDTAFTTLVGQGFDIYWGAYLALADEILVAGPLDEVADDIVRCRAEARQRKGWIFDIYLLRRQQAARATRSGVDG